MSGMTRNISLGALALVLTGCCAPNAPSCQNESIGPSEGEVVGVIVGVVAAAGVATAVLINVEHTHHNVKGCISTTPAGLEITDAKTRQRFLLSGATADLKGGSLVRIHGSRAKKPHGSTSDQGFVVQSLNKNYGACTMSPPP
jgi:hypothetical protein